MKVICYITLFCLISGGLAGGLFARQAAAEIFLGMLPPLLLGIVTILLVERAYRTDPKKITAFMTKAFFGKMLLYGGYVVLILGFCSFQARPFAISLIVYFTGLHITEALYFRTMFNAKRDILRSS